MYWRLLSDTFSSRALWSDSGSTERRRPGESMDEAYDLLCDVMNAVEDQHSGVVYDPDNFLNDGRFYPPKADARRDVEGREDLIRYRSRMHNTYLSSEGAIRIQSVAKAGKPVEVILDKPGLSGRKVEL